MTVKKEQDWLDIAEHYGIKQIPVAIEEMALLITIRSWSAIRS